nr:aldehyde dehydrogenase family protein [Paraburkholderia dipogonis]
MVENLARAALDSPEVHRLFANAALGIELLPAEPDPPLNMIAGEPELVRDPATNKCLARVKVRGQEVMRAAIDEADRAFKTWRDTLAEERRTVLRAWGQPSGVRAFHWHGS